METLSQVLAELSLGFLIQDAPADRVTILLPLMFSALTCCPVLSLKLTELLQWYATTFRDPLMLQPPEWFKAFIYCEAFLQLPFFPIAAYAFLKGWCKASV
uniref:Uncharacterized protein n=1 Tax=Melopsittacus undulatus TaxID=13146 RepID=A0A8V5GA97_MELUD